MNPLRQTRLWTTPGNKKDITWDLAYFKWTPCEHGSLTGGKVELTFYRPGDLELIIDSDWTPEGLLIEKNFKNDNWGYFAKAGGFWLDERDVKTDAFLVAAQLGGDFFFGEQQIRLGIGRYHYFNTRGQTTLVQSGAGFGNTITGTTYDYGYEINEAFVAWHTLIGAEPFKLFADLAQNARIETGNGAFAVGFELGQIKEKGDLAFNYNFRRVERDSVIGALADSDFAGGETDADGHKASLRYQAAPRVITSLTYFDNRKDLADPISYKRAQADLIVRF